MAKGNRFCQNLKVARLHEEASLSQATPCVEIAVFCPLPHTFAYIWPKEFGKPEAGLRAIISFGRGQRTGVIVNTPVNVPEGIECKPVIDRLDHQPIYDAKRIHWLERAEQYYTAAPGEMWETALAWAAGEEKRRWHCADKDALIQFDPGLAEAFSNRSALSAGTLAKRLPPSGFHHRLHQAEASGLLQEVVPEPDTERLQMGEERIPEQLTPAQTIALTAIEKAEAFNPFLLFGCTGSGKTEVYIRAALSKIGAGGQVLILVPEIGLTPQWLSRIRKRFSSVAVWHSALSDKQRRAVRAGLADVEVLIGTRSALFLPLPRLSMVVVDEEHDSSFKQQEGVAYSARDLAVLLAQEVGIPVVLGSATPSLESWRHIKSGQYQLLSLPEPIVPHPSPVPHIVDICGSESPLSESMLKALQETKQQGSQSLLYLNRRGYAPALNCTACGDVPECPACSLRLTLHRKRGQLRCHACGFIRPVPHVCEQCGEDALLPLGAGTEKIEEQLEREFPELRFARLDRDAVRSEKKLLRVLSDFSTGKLDCLIGTQMLIKGHHFPKVTLVGVVNADLGLSLPDFRAGERWWQQLTQVLGRAGRGENPGKIVIQTFDPKAPWLSKIGDRHAEATLDEELGRRQVLNYPPYARWVRIIFSSGNAARANEAASKMADILRQMPGVRLVGPMPCAIERLATRYRFEILLQDETRKHLPWALSPIFKRLPVPPGVRRKIDVDPVDMM